jgi:hypothetical protein
MPVCSCFIDKFEAFAWPVDSQRPGFLVIDAVKYFSKLFRSSRDYILNFSNMKCAYTASFASLPRTSILVIDAISSIFLRIKMNLLHRNPIQAEAIIKFIAGLVLVVAN